MEEILDLKNKNSNKITLGLHKENEVYLMKGKYGMYINCNGKNMSISHIKKEMNEIKMDDILDVLNGKKSKNSSIIKEISCDISIRKGKYGPYIFYKTKQMKKPKFIPMKGITIDDVNENWVLNKINK